MALHTRGACPIFMAIFLWLAVHRFSLSATPLVYWLLLPVLAFSLLMIAVRALIVRGTAGLASADFSKSLKSGIAGLFILFFILGLGGFILLGGFLVAMAMGPEILKIELIRAFGLALVLSASIRILIDGIIDANIAVKVWKYR